MPQRIAIIRPRGIYDGQTPTLKVSSETWKLASRVGHRFGVNAHMDTEISFDAEQVRSIVSALSRALDYVPAKAKAAKATKVPVNAVGPEPQYHEYCAPVARPHAMPVAPLDAAERDAVTEVLRFLATECGRGCGLQWKNGY